MNELDRVLNVQKVSCKGLVRPSRDPRVSGIAANMSRFDAYIDIVAAAVQCGVSRVATVAVADYSANFANMNASDMHFGIAHKAYQSGGFMGNKDTGPQFQAIATRAHQGVFEKIVLKMANALDVPEAGGSTYLDNSLIVWTQEYGSIHDCISLPVITFGSAGARLRTGLYCDYRKRTPEGGVYPPGYAKPEERASAVAHYQNPGRETIYQGLLYSQFLSTVLTAMGVPQAEWGLDGNLGRLFKFRTMERNKAPSAAKFHYYNDGYFDTMTQILPFLGPG